MFTFFQFGISTGDVPVVVTASTFDAEQVLGGFAALVLASAVGLIVLWLWRRFHVHPVEHRLSFQTVILLVTLPKDAASDKPQEMTHEKVRERIAVAETLMATICSLTQPYRFWRPTRPMSFEIVAMNKRIYFYVAVPRQYEQVIEQHIHAQYPEANIQAVVDYNIFQPHGVIAAGYLRAKREPFFPFKTYKTLDSDPLSAITNVMSKLGEDEGATLQIVFTSASRRWRKKGKRLVHEMEKGTRLALAMIRSQRWMITRAFLDIGGIFTRMYRSSEEEKQRMQSMSGAPHRLSPKEEELMKLIEEKISKVGLNCSIRLVVSASSLSRAQSQLESMYSAFSQYTIFEYGNAFLLRRPRDLDGILHDFIFRKFRLRQSVVINSEEFSSIFHFPLPTTETHNIQWLLAKNAGPPVNMPTTGIMMGVAEYRGETAEVRIMPEDRRRHVYIIGRSGVGKSVLMTQMAIQDITNGSGIGVIDPHGDLVNDILERIPASRAEDVVYFNPADIERPMGLNLLEYDPKYPEQKTFVINEMIKIFDKLYDLRQTGGPMFEQYMRNSMLLVMEDPESGSTLMEIPKVLADKEFRTYKLQHCVNPVVKDFWTKEAEKAGGEASLANMVPYITSKLTQFVANDMMRPIIAQQTSAFNIRELMDGKKILLINLSKGRLGDINAYLIGMILVGKILMASLSRTDIPQEERTDFYLYIDEFQNFITDSIATILSEARKYRLDLTIAHQYMGQLVEKQDTKIRDAVLGNAGTMVSFRIGVEDAEILEKEYTPIFNKYDLVNIEAYHAYVKLLIKNQASRPFTLKTIPLSGGNVELAEKMRALSRLKYGRDRKIVEQEILDRVMRVEKTVEEPAPIDWKL